MKKLATLTVTAALVVGSQVAIVPDAQAFSFGSFSFSDDWGDSWGDGWGDSWGNGGYRSGYNPRWNRYPPPAYRNNSWNNGPRWNRGFNEPRFNFSDGDGFGWGNRNGPRWGAYPAPTWGPPPWANVPKPPAQSLNKPEPVKP